MRKTKFLKGVGIVALSSVLAFGAAASMTACKSKAKATELTVHIFCDDADVATNEAITKKWEAWYNETHRDENGTDIAVKFTNTNNKNDYFDKIKQQFNSGKKNVADVIYLAPRYVQKYAKLNYVMDLSEYLSADDIAALQGVWSNAYSYYGYNSNKDYRLGQTIQYDASQGAFVTANGGEKVGLYGLPKDYSNFSLGFNRQFFSNELVLAYQKNYGSTAENRGKNSAAAVNDYVDVKGAVAPVSQYAGAPIATYAAGGTRYIYNYDGTVESQENVAAGQEAPIIAIGIPVTYKPFNFYLWNSYSEALSGGDPIANLTQALSGGNGFTVTIPGFPGQSFKVSDASSTTNAVNANSQYDSSIGHITYTYQEYGALTWALTYYLNTFAWDENNEGYGGRTLVEGNETKHQTIYGGEQYEYAQGCELYVLPWMAANDADFIDELATTALGGANAAENRNTYQELLLDKNSSKLASELASDYSETRTKINLDGTTRNVSVQSGMNTERFIETYAAYQNHGALWNANCGPAKDRATDPSNNSGWNYFRQGRSIFYGAGSWDAATRNDADSKYFTFGQMPTPVSESYALYSTTPTPDYEIGKLITYSNGATKGTNSDAASDRAQRSDKTAGIKAYERGEVLTNQLLRQDKWAGRMDSVGYAANARLAEEKKKNSAEAWKADAATSLIVMLTAEEETQQMLTYAGAQLPNFRQQCSEFLKYQSAEYRESGTFKDMLTPAGFADTTDPVEGKAIWDYYYSIAVAMAKDSHNSSKSGQTVAEWIAANGYGDYEAGKEKGSATKALRYDPQYANLKLSEFTGASSNNYYTGMKVLRMVNMTYEDRDLNIRMQCGLNAVRDSTMYTPEDSWLMSLNAAVATDSMLTYYSSIAPFTREGNPGNGQPSRNAIQDGSAFVRNFADQNAGADSQYANGDAVKYGYKKFWSPAYYCYYYAIICEQNLRTVVKVYQESMPV